MRALMDLAAPITCIGCGRTSDDELCEPCAHRIRPIVRPFCERCGAPGPAGAKRRRDERPCTECPDLEGFVRARSLVTFAEPARRLTLALKRRGRPALVAGVGTLVADLARAEAFDAATVTFVPAGRRADRRGFDPASLLARAVARELARPLRTLLVRIADGPRQADVGMAERRSNVRGRFGARRAEGSVLLVDDVYTTGATAEACALALLDAGAESVDVVTWARSVRRLTRES